MGFEKSPHRHVDMPYKLVLSDLDGTFLDDNREIPERNAEAVRLMTEKGVLFGFASGRSYHSLNRFYDALSLLGRGLSGIAFNGAVVYEIDTYDPLSVILLKNDVMQYLVGLMRPFLKDIYVYGPDGTLYSEYLTDTFTGYATRSNVPHRVADFGGITEDIVKILLLSDYEVISKVHDRLADVVPGLCNMIFSSKRMLEFTDLRASKGNALAFLGERLNIGIDDIIAVGDNYNDESMIARAGLGVVTANAEDGLKPTADYVTEATNNDGALMEIVERFL